jgi:hypothetical protein
LRKSVSALATPALDLPLEEIANGEVFQFGLKCFAAALQTAVCLFESRALAR